MTIVAANWVGENTSTVGTGPLALSGAISTFCPFSVLPDGSEVYYTLQEGFNRETGIGVVSNGTLTRKVQATLVAGVYAETDIPISLSGNGQVFAVINADFMTRIYNFSLDVADSVSAAASSAKSSSDSASLANDYKTQSAQNAESAATSAQSASDSQIAANASKNAAAASASAAAISQADALASKNASAASQADALASKNAAKTSETNSKASETASAQSATNASNSAAAALASQNAAKTSEDNAAVSRTGAGQSALAAKDSENAAKTSETNSKTSEANAKTSETNAASSATAAANSAALAQQYQPNTALQLFTTFVNAAAGNTMDSNLADGVYPVTADSPGAPLAVTGKVWVTHRGSNCQQTWESQVAAGTVNYGRKFFRTGVGDDAGGITWGDWREHVFMDLNKITKVLRGVDGIFTLGADGANPLDAVSLRQMQAAIANVSGSGGINGVMSTFIGDVSWWIGAAGQILPTGYVDVSGQLLLRSDYPEIWSLISAGVLPSNSESFWQSEPTGRGNFSTGTVTSGANANFRMPDLNGLQSGSIPGLFLRGSAKGDPNSGGLGTIRENAAPNIAGAMPYVLASSSTLTFGAFANNWQNFWSQAPAGGNNTCTYRENPVTFDASRSSTSYGKNSTTEVRPNSIKGTWIMRMKGTFSAQTSFAVMISVASNPANSTTTEGGKVRSTLVGPSGEIGGADLSYKHVVDGAGVVTKSAVIGVTGGAGNVEISNSGAISTSDPATTMTGIGLDRPVDVAWITPTMQNGFSITLPTKIRTGYRKVLGMLQLCLNVSANAAKNDGTIITILPAGYRPAMIHSVLCSVLGVDINGARVDINTNGEVTCQGYNGSTREVRFQVMIPLE